jgi:hypothetical protein
MEKLKRRVLHDGVGITLEERDCQHGRRDQQNEKAESEKVDGGHVFTPCSS